MKADIKTPSLILFGLTVFNAVLLLIAYFLSFIFPYLGLLIINYFTLSLVSTLIAAKQYSKYLDSKGKALGDSVIERSRQNSFKKIEESQADHLDSVVSAVNRFFENAATQQLEVSRKYNQAKSLINTMTDGLLTINGDGFIESANSASLDLLGLVEDEIARIHLSAITNDPAASSAQKFLESFICEDGSKQANSELEVVKGNGELLSVRFSVSKMSTAGSTTYVVLISDISDIKEMEKQLRALNIELSKSNERLEKTSITDALTQLFNRRHFDAMMIKELQRCTRQRTSLSLLMVDIDFFKQFNDIYGHSAGDDGIKKVAESIKKVFKRSGDLPARYGGEEFAIILPGCDGLELQERAETLRQEIYDLAIPHSASRADEFLTVSVGAVTYKPQSTEVVAPKPKELFSEADKALYRAKANGRNQVIFGGLYQPVKLPAASGHLYGQLFSR